MIKNFSLIGVVQVFIELKSFISWIIYKTDTKLYNPDSLKHLNDANEWLKLKK